MTKKELMEKLEDFNDNDVVIIMNSLGGWCNINTIKQEGCEIAIVHDEDPLFKT